MGYWATSLEGHSLQLVGDLNPDGSEMLWGDAPADRIDAGLHALIVRLKGDLGRHPTVAEVDAARAAAPEMADAVAGAREVFARDTGRPATDGEVAAGLAFADTGIVLDSFLRSDIAVGDRVRWAVMRPAGFFREVDHIAEGTVAAIEDRRVRSSWSDSYYVKTFLVVRREDSVDDVEKAYATRVIDGDEPVEAVNARRRGLAGEGGGDE